MSSSSKLIFDYEVQNYIILINRYNSQAARNCREWLQTESCQYRKVDNSEWYKFYLISFSRTTYIKLLQRFGDPVAFDEGYQPECIYNKDDIKAYFVPPTKGHASASDLGFNECKEHWYLRINFRGENLFDSAPKLRDDYLDSKSFKKLLAGSWKSWRRLIPLLQRYLNFLRVNTLIEVVYDTTINSEIWEFLELVGFRPYHDCEGHYLYAEPTQ